MCEYVLRVFHALRQHSHRGFMQKAAGIPESSRTTHRQKAANVLWTVIRLREREREGEDEKELKQQQHGLCYFRVLRKQRACRGQKNDSPAKAMQDCVRVNDELQETEEKKNRPQRAAEHQKVKF